VVDHDFAGRSRLLLDPHLHVQTVAFGGLLDHALDTVRRDAFAADVGDEVVAGRGSADEWPTA